MFMEPIQQLVTCTRSLEIYIRVITYMHAQAQVFVDCDSVVLSASFPSLPPNDRSQNIYLNKLIKTFEDCFFFFLSMTGFLLLSVEMFILFSAMKF